MENRNLCFTFLKSGKTSCYGDDSTWVGCTTTIREVVLRHCSYVGRRWFGEMTWLNFLACRKWGLVTFKMSTGERSSKKTVVTDSMWTSAKHGLANVNIFDGICENSPRKRLNASTYSGVLHSTEVETNQMWTSPRLVHVKCFTTLYAYSVNCSWHQIDTVRHWQVCGGFAGGEETGLDIHPAHQTCEYPFGLWERKSFVMRNLGNRYAQLLIGTVLAEST